MQIKSDLGTMITAGTLLVLGTVGWFTLSSKVDKVGEQVADLKRDKADRECLAILNRQATAEEKNRLAIVTVLSSLAEQRGCFERPGTAMMAAADAMRPIARATVGPDGSISPANGGFEFESSAQAAMAAADGSLSDSFRQSLQFWDAIDRVDRQLAKPPETRAKP